MGSVSRRANTRTATLQDVYAMVIEELEDEETDDEATAFDRARRVLDEHFQQLGSLIEEEIKLDLLRQKKGETTYAFAMRLLRQASKVFPSGHEGRTERIQVAIIKGLRLYSTNKAVKEKARNCRPESWRNLLKIQDEEDVDTTTEVMYVGSGGGPRERQNNEHGGPNRSSGSWRPTM